MNNKIVIVALIAVMSILGCQKIGKVFSNENKPIKPPELANKTFVLKTVNGGQVQPMNPDRPPQIAFSTPTKLHGNICNNFFGEYTLENGVLTAQVASTMMLCPTETLNTTEQNFFRLLADGANIRLEQHRLTLENHENRFAFEQVK